MAKDISSVLLDLVAFFSKEGAALPQAVLDAAKRCALGNFRGDLHQPVPAIVL
jgi:FKBP12-rapamycin complex-associated protein